MEGECLGCCMFNFFENYFAKGLFHYSIHLADHKSSTLEP